MSSNLPLFIFGDIHGYLETLQRHLRYAGLATSDAQWRGADAQLWFMGDFADRGPDGVGVIDYVMRLQADAARKGGVVGALSGNHDFAILAARLLPMGRTSGPRGEFYPDWVDYGGIPSDEERLEARHVEWLRSLPAMALVNDRMLMHADALFYLYYGNSVQAVNAAFARVARGLDAREWDRMLAYAGERLLFDDKRPGSAERARDILRQFGGTQIIHGHTPIPMLSGEPIERVTRAFVYADGLVVDVDGGIYKGGAGFLHEVVPQAMNGTQANANERGSLSC